ncbi:hypothetical protein CXB51_000716 [Gossypium anomalum]|uniref:Premnaspirodiene oxygenase-like n=1 Tax=Gossypium anomalum TaxID=47600 RepID=A0A8J6A277_9ROSI|nr:hypothetical protein CXB51_000716 [Gossypium anomalum]
MDEIQNKGLTQKSTACTIEATSYRALSLFNFLSSPSPLDRISQKTRFLVAPKLGELSHIVLSSPEAAREVMKTHDINFANRPFLLDAEIIMHHFSDIAFASHGGYWRQLRKVCTLELLSTKCVQSFRSEESSLSYSITLRMAFSGRCKQHEAFISILRKLVEAAAGFSIADLFPSIKLLHVISGMEAKLERTFSLVELRHLIGGTEASPTIAEWEKVWRDVKLMDMRYQPRPNWFLMHEPLEEIPTTGMKPRGECVLASHTVWLFSRLPNGMENEDLDMTEAFVYPLVLHMFTMDKLLPLSFTFLVFIFMVLKLWMRSKIKETPKNLPPSPWKLPIIGHLHLLIFALPHRRLTELAKRHGSVMQLQLGELSHIVVSSPEAAKEVMKTHDINFANRPFLLAAEIILYNSSDIAFAHWRQLRKVCTLELLSTKRVQSFRSIREENVSSLIRSIYSNTGLEINLGEMLCNLSYNITLRTAFAGRCNQHEAFISFVKKFVESLAGFSIADLFPSIKLLHVISGMRAKLERFHHDLDLMLESIIEEHRASNANLENSDDETDDLLDVLLNLQDHGGLEFPLTTDNIKLLSWLVV